MRKVLLIFASIFVIRLAWGNPEPANPVRVLVVGNSIVHHPPRSSIGWTNDWGMAASSRENDFAHLVAKGIGRNLNRPFELRIGFAAELESKFREKRDYTEDLKEDVSWQPEYVVIALGENVNKLSSKKDADLFGEALYRFGKVFKDANPDVKMVYRSVFWGDPVRNRRIKEAATRLSAKFGDVGNRGNELRFQARGEYANSGVACHPNDNGMRMLSRVVLEALGMNVDELDAEAPVVQAGEMPQGGGGILRKINKDWKCKYSKRFLRRRQQRGVAIDSRGLTPEDAQTLEEWGANTIRYWIVFPSATNIVQRREYLDCWLDKFENEKVPLVRKHSLMVNLLMSNVPGGRDPQSNYRLFDDARYLAEFREEWKIIAERLKKYDFLSYDLCNEPHQTRVAKVCDYWTAQRLVAEDIRKIDPEVPVIIEAYGWDGPEAFWAMSPMKLTNIVYQVHMYYPMVFTHQGLYSWKMGPEYPSEKDGWNREYLIKTFSQVRNFERQHGARIYCGEFSAAAWAKGAEKYIADCISVLNEFGWDWTYHAFREYEGWSVEHEGPDRLHCPRVNYETLRKRALLKGLRGAQTGCEDPIDVKESIERHSLPPDNQSDDVSYVEALKSTRYATVSARQTPDWLKRGYIYQIQPRAFTAEGTLRAAMEKLPLVRNAGAGIVYLMPVNVLDDETNHMSRLMREVGQVKGFYRTKDYFNTDPEFGTNDDRKNFVAAAHRLGMKVIFDVVLYHCGHEAVLIGKGADWIERNQDGSPKLGKWKRPVLNYRSRGLREYLLSALSYLVADVDVDGFRCDVAEMVPCDFWEEAHERLSAIKPDVVLICEGYGCPGEQEKAFDCCYDWRGMEALRGALDGKVPLSNIRKEWNIKKAHCECGSRFLRYVENHDETDASQGKGARGDSDERWGAKLMEAALFYCFTADGIPFLFNGNEFADRSVQKTPLLRSPIDWSKRSSPEGLRRLDFVRKFAALRRKDDAFSTDALLEWVDTDHPDEILAYVKSSRDGSSRRLCVVNLTKNPVNEFRLSGFGTMSLGASEWRIRKIESCNVSCCNLMTSIDKNKSDGRTE